MLVLTRRIGERIKIGDTIVVTIVGVNGRQVRIGTDAPREVVILRQEIYERSKREQAGGHVLGQE